MAALIARDVTRATAQVAHFTASRDFSSEAVEQLSVNGLVLKLVEDPACVLAGETIIAFANRSATLPVIVRERDYQNA